MKASPEIQTELLRLCAGAFVEVRYLTGCCPARPEDNREYDVAGWQHIGYRLSWLADLCHNLPDAVQGTGTFEREPFAPAYAWHLSEEAQKAGLDDWAKAFEQLAREKFPVEVPKTCVELKRRADQGRAVVSVAERPAPKTRVPWWKRMFSPGGEMT